MYYVKAIGNSGKTYLVCGDAEGSFRCFSLRLVKDFTQKCNGYVGFFNMPVAFWSNNEDANLAIARVMTVSKATDNNTDMPEAMKSFAVKYIDI